MRYLLFLLTIFVFFKLGYSQIYISEVSDASSYHQEFMELYNNSDNDVDLHDYKIIRVDANTDTAQYVYDIGTNESSTISGSDFIIPAHGFMIFARGSSQADFESIWGTLPAGTAFNVGNTYLYFGVDTHYRWRLRANDGTANADDGTLLDDTGQAVGGSGYRNYQQSIGGTWIQDNYQNATPGYFDNDQSLPVTLTSFEALAQTYGVLLTWRTESEVENLGFEIFRSLSENGQYSLIDSYLDNPELKGQGNSSVGKTYHYTDQTVQKGTTYYYKLADVSFGGQKTFHGPIKVQVTQNQLNVTSNSAPKTFKLYPNHPNPFNPSTEIVFDLPISKQNTVQARLDIYNINGQKVRSLLQQSLPTGKQYQIHWDGKDDFGNMLPAGIYFGFLKAGNFQQSVKMCLVK